MNKLTLIKGKVMACLFLTCLFIAQGCKKDILLQKDNHPITSSKIRNITYDEFINSINLKATGSLSTVLTGAKEKVMNTETLAGNLSLIMDSVKLLHLGDTLSYVISIKPQTPRATVFQNLTIQVVKDKTTAFLSTYYPAKEWIDRWRAGHVIAFKDKVEFNKVNLDDAGINTKNLSKANFVQDNGLKGKIIASISSPSGIPNIISLAPGECEVYDIYTVVPHQCSTGDWPGTCPWEVGGIPESGGFLPYFSLERTTGVDCAPPAAGESGVPGSSGGGSTVPTPPPAYNPCNGGTPTVSVNFERGTKLAILPPTPCDPLVGMPEGADPSFSASARYLFDILQISDDRRKNFLHTHTVLTNQLVTYLANNGSTQENREFVSWAVGYLMVNPSDIASFSSDNFGSEDFISDKDYDSNDLTFDINNNGSPSFVSNNINFFGFQSQIEPDYPQSHPVSQVIENYSPWIYYAFAGANNTSIKHFHQTAKGLAGVDGYSKGIGAIGEGLFVKRLTSSPIFPYADVVIGKYVGTTHIDVFLQRVLPTIGNIGFEIAINYTTIDGTPAVNKISHPKGFTLAGITTTAVAYEVKTYNADKNTEQSLFKAFNEGVRQVRHRANLPGIGAAVLVFDDRAWSKLINSTYGGRVINTMNEITAVTNLDGEQIIYLRIEKGLTRDAQKVYFDLKGRIKNL